jgi:hypothetical protein
MSLSQNKNTLPILDPNIIPLDYQKLLLNGTSKQLKDNIIKLLNEINNLKKQNSELKIRNAACSYAEIQLLNAEKKIKDLQEENNDNLEKHYKEQKKLENQIEQLTFQKEKDEKKNIKNMEIFNQRIEIMNHVELENSLNKEEIKNLNEKNEKLKKEHENLLRKQQVRNEIKFDKLKKKMIDNLKETQKNVTKLNIEYMDVSNKLTLLQNNELILKIEYQSNKIEELEKNNKILKDKIFSLENELEIHKNVEIKLANKLKKHSMSQNLSLETDNNNKSNFTNDISLKTNVKNSKNYINNKLMSFISTNKSSLYNESAIFISGQEKKIINLEKNIKNKKDEIERLKNQLSESNLKILNYENKYSGLFNFFEECLNKFYEDEELKEYQNFFINLDLIKKCDFTLFSKEEQYSLLVLIMKYLLPIINLNFNATCNIGNNIFKTNLNVINKQFNQTNNFLNDEYLRRAFVGKSNRLKSNLNLRNLTSYYNNSIPIMKSEKTEKEKKIKLEPKYKSLIDE